MCVVFFVTQWCLTLQPHVACQALLSMRILQSRILEWVAMPSSRGSSQPRDGTQVSRIAGGFFTIKINSIYAFLKTEKLFCVTLKW